MFVFDTRHTPLYLQAFPQTFCFDEVDQHFNEVERYFRARPRTAPAALLADARSVLNADARSRKRVAEAFDRLGPLMAPRAVAHAIVLNNAIVSNALTAIFWIARPPWVVRTFTNMEAADAWIRSRFAETGRPEPAAPPDWWAEGAAAKVRASRSA